MLDFNKRINDFEEFYLKRDSERAKTVVDTDSKKVISGHDNRWSLLLMVAGFILLILSIGIHAYKFNELAKENQALKERVRENEEMIAAVSETTLILRSHYAIQKKEIESLMSLAENGGAYVEPNNTNSADSSVSNNKPADPDPKPDPDPTPDDPPSPDPTPSKKGPSPGSYHDDTEYHENTTRY